MTNIQPPTLPVKPVDAAVYSLWLTAAGSVRDRLAHTIAVLAGRFGTPAFEPHVTLLSGLTGSEDEVGRGAENLARRAGPISIRLGRVGFEDEYFRCCFLVAEGNGLLAARRLGKAVFSLESAAYAPHLSLIYGRLPVSVRERLRSEIERMLPVVFDARTLEVWQTTGQVVSWKRVASFRLAPGS